MQIGMIPFLRPVQNLNEKQQLTGYFITYILLCQFLEVLGGAQHLFCFWPFPFMATAYPPFLCKKYPISSNSTHYKGSARLKLCNFSQMLQGLSTENSRTSAYPLVASQTHHLKSRKKTQDFTISSILLNWGGGAAPMCIWLGIPIGKGVKGKTATRLITILHLTLERNQEEAAG